MLKNTKGVIFDFNGTLFFDSDKHEKAWKLFSKEARSNPFSDLEIMTHVHGRTNKSILEYLYQKDISTEVLNAFIQKKESYYRKACLEDKANLKLVDGAIELFRYLIENNIKKTIATAAEMTNLQFFIQQFELDKWFDKANIIYDDGKIAGKPAPDMYLKAANAINIHPSECLVFEDSESGIMAARNAGIGKIIVLDPLGSDSKFQNYPGIDSIIRDFNEFQKTTIE